MESKHGERVWRVGMESEHPNMEEESAGRLLEAVQCQNYFGIKLTMKSGKGSLPVEDGDHC